MIIHLYNKHSWKHIRFSNELGKMQLSVCYFKMILNDTWRLFISELCKTSSKLHLEDISRLNMTSVAERLLNATTRLKPRGKTLRF